MLSAVPTSVSRQRFHLRARGASVPHLSVEALPASSARSPAQPVRIAVFLPESMFDPVEELGQDFKPQCDLAGRFSSLTQPNQ